MSKKELKVWILFICLNCLLFLPRYILEADISSFIPYRGFLEGSLYQRFKYLYIRPNYDIFRLSADLLLILVIYYFFRKKIGLKLYSRISGIYYVIILLFLIYYNSMEKIFKVKPMLYNDIHLFRLAFVNSGVAMIKGLLLAGLLIGITIGFIRIFRYLLTLIRDIQPGRYSKIALLLLGSFLLIKTLWSGVTFEPIQGIQETCVLMVQNLGLSLEAYNSQRKIKVTDLVKETNYDRYQWKEKPNLYVLFFESYGKIVYTDPSLQGPYLKELDHLEASLEKQGWKTASAFSISPVSGGDSWVSYSSFMLGYNIRNEGTYLYLLKNKGLNHYDHLFRLFGKKGYTNYRLSSMEENPSLDIPWKTFSAFYDVDQWILFRDMNYQGKLYGFGPSPPDQYALFFAGNFIKQHTAGPFTFFWINQNSHNPFYCPDSLVADWKSLSDGRDISNQKSDFLKKPSRKDYSKAINYDLQVFIHFIEQEGSGHDIFLIIGDHQPPLLTHQSDSFETPVHIISRDGSFIQHFVDDGFVHGMAANDQGMIFRHEGLYSLFMREFLRSYGTDSTDLPRFRPAGITPSR